MEKEIKIKFDENSPKYDSQRKKLIPCFEDFYNISTSVVETNLNCPNILDLGAGTGIFSEYILKKYPNASITLFDLSEKMLEISQKRFKGVTNIKYLVGDYIKYDFNETYDIIISSLSIHHLSNDNKFRLFKKCFSLLNNKGTLINADQFLGETPYIENLNKKLWKDKIENSGLSKDEILSCYERITLDKEATLSQHIDWFKKIGFKDISCVYKYYHFGVILGKKVIN